jgi:hypothetical protein
VHRPALDVSDDDWELVVDVNLNGLWRCSQAFGRHMIERGGGVIVNIGSISADVVNRPQWQPAYNASKAAVHQLTKSLAAEWAPHNVRVNALAPGYAKTDMAPVDRPEFRRHWIEDAPMQRYAMPGELGPALVFLASDASSFMTGARHIVLPMLSGVLIVALLIRSMDAIRYFDIITNTTNGGPADATKIVPIRLYETAFRFFDLGYAAAIGLSMLAATIVLANVFMRIMKARGLAR